jgi:hypothetical protein
MSRVAFVPDDFQPPLRLVVDRFLFEPLGPEHNEDDHEAWSSSIEHIRATPGFRNGRWPHSMTLEENRADLERHARDFAARTGFTYTVLDPSDRGVIGCVYIYPDKKGVDDAVVTSWVRATRARCDAALARSFPAGWWRRGHSIGSHTPDRRRRSEQSAPRAGPRTSAPRRAKGHSLAPRAAVPGAGANAAARRAARPGGLSQEQGRLDHHVVDGLADRPVVHLVRAGGPARAGR